MEILQYNMKAWSENVLGFLGEHLRLYVTVKFTTEDRDLQYFVKSVPFSNSEQRRLILEHGIVKKESNIYELMLNHFPSTILNVKWRPECYFWREDLLVLEDLSNQGYYLTPDRFDYTNDHVQSILRSLATLHAASKFFEKNVLKDKISNHFLSVLFETTTSPKCDWFITGLKAIRGIALHVFPQHRTFIDGQMWIELWKIFQHIENSVHLFPCVLTHRDVWSKNLLFNKSLECILLDFQIARYLPQAYDVVMCQYLLLRTPERRLHYTENLRTYYSQYSRVMEHFDLHSDQISFETLERSCKHFELMGLIMKAITTQISHLPENFMKDLLKDPTGYKNFEVVDRTDQLLALLEHDSYYKSWMVEAVEELLDYTIATQSAGVEIAG